MAFADPVELGERPPHLSEFSPREVLLAQLAASEFELEEPLDEEQAAAEREAARRVLSAFSEDVDAGAARTELSALQTPEAVRHVQRLLDARDWDFVSRVNDIRGYIMTELMKLTESSDPKMRFAALKTLGTVTEVALFTERVAVDNIHRLSDNDLDARIKDKLARLPVFGKQAVVDVIPVTPVPAHKTQDTKPDTDFHLLKTVPDSDSDE
jgi:hypothetical protein